MKTFEIWIKNVRTNEPMLVCTVTGDTLDEAMQMEQERQKTLRRIPIAWRYRKPPSEKALHWRVNWELAFLSKQDVIDHYKLEENGKEKVKQD